MSACRIPWCGSPQSCTQWTQVAPPSVGAPEPPGRCPAPAGWGGPGGLPSEVLSSSWTSFVPMGRGQKVTGPGRDGVPAPIATPQGSRYLSRLFLLFRCCLAAPIFPRPAFLFLVFLPFSFRQRTVEGRWPYRPGENLGDNKMALSEHRLSWGWLGSFWKDAETMLTREQGYKRHNRKLEQDHGGQNVDHREL